MVIFYSMKGSINAFLDGQYNVSVVLCIKRKNRLGSRFFRGFSKLGNFWTEVTGCTRPLKPNSVIPV